MIFCSDTKRAGTVKLKSLYCLFKNLGHVIKYKKNSLFHVLILMERRSVIENVVDLTCKEFAVASHCAANINRQVLESIRIDIELIWSVPSFTKHTQTLAQISILPLKRYEVLSLFVGGEVV